VVKQHAVLDELIAHGVPARLLEPKRDFDQHEPTAQPNPTSRTSASRRPREDFRTSPDRPTPARDGSAAHRGRQHEQGEGGGRDQAADDHPGQRALDLSADPLGERGRQETDDGTIAETTIGRKRISHARITAS